MALLSLWALACTNTPNSPSAVVTPVDASGPVDRPVDRHVVTDDSGSQCGWPSALDNGGLAGCAPARAFV